MLEHTKRRYGTSGDERYYSELYEDTVYEREGVSYDYDGGQQTGNSLFSDETGNSLLLRETGNSLLLRETGNSPLLRNRRTGERVFLRRLNLETHERGEYLRRILDPPAMDRILWPLDLIRLDNGAEQECTLFVDHAYIPDGTPHEPCKTRYAVAMPVPETPLRSWEQIRKYVQPFEWHSASARAFAVQLADLLDRLNHAGWYCNDLHVSRLFLRPDGQLALDYSNLIQPVRTSDTTTETRTRSGNAVQNRTRSDDTNHRFSGTAFHTLRRHNYSLAFADPAVIQGRVPVPDKISQDYTLAAILFYLFFGRGPYDGGLFAGYPDDTPYNQEIRQRDILRLPVFMFDPEDVSNLPGAFAEDEHILTLWAECPAILQEYFLRALRRETAERRGTEHPPEASEWLSVFRELDWIPENGPLPTVPV